jgi:hypothetical protein
MQPPHYLKVYTVPVVGVCSILYLLDDNSTEDSQDCLDIRDELFLLSLVQFFS